MQEEITQMPFGLTTDILAGERVKFIIFRGLKMEKIRLEQVWADIASEFCMKSTCTFDSVFFPVENKRNL